MGQGQSTGPGGRRPGGVLALSWDVWPWGDYLQEWPSTQLTCLRGLRKPQLSGMSLLLLSCYYKGNWSRATGFGRCHSFNSHHLFTHSLTICFTCSLNKCLLLCWALGQVLGQVQDQTRTYSLGRVMNRCHLDFQLHSW